ncbi:MAG: hypothetical protein LBI63_03585, partial [Candidatus Ancillula sp.]|jgi:hypothetical protein|nr:hypothetical protein [Candidatus Ancillula sp.]
LYIADGGTLHVDNTGRVIVEPGGEVENDGTQKGKLDGSKVSDLSLSSTTTTSITINQATLMSETGQQIEYAISTTPTLPTDNWQAETTFSGLLANTSYYIFARSKENEVYKTGIAKTIAVQTSVDPKSVAELIINPNQIQGAWVDANGVLHANQNGTITILLHEKLHDGEEVEAKLHDYDLSSSVDSDIIKDNTVTFPHASPHIITASLLSNPSIKTQVLVEVESDGAKLAKTGVDVKALGFAVLMMLLLGVGARKKV